MQAAIYGVAGEALTADEGDFFRDADPIGYCLFRRNCVSPGQVLALADELRSLHGREGLAVMIDQEGGRVARLQPPAWPAFPAAGRFGELYRVAPASAIEAARANAQAIGMVLKECGVNVNFLPVLDVRQEGAHDIIGDRAFGYEPMQVAALGRSVLEGMAAAGVVGVVKHMPGHGRSLGDSHLERPVVEAGDEALEVDIEPFRTLRSAAMGMVCHLVYTAWDSGRPASLSPVVIGGIIRGRIGFGGLLMSDDLGMRALTGSFAGRAEGALDAGCDVAMHCSGDMAEMVDFAAGVRPMTGEAMDRLERAMAGVAGADGGASFDELAAKRDALIALA